jgi:glycosyltransferase involved in cell wall biosynthesis
MDTRAPMLSVVVAVYDTAAYLRECLDSLFAQTFCDLEIIIVDDGSTDESPAIVAEYAAAYPDRTTVITRANGGLSDARNAGIAAARGKYVGFVDGDDHVSVEMFDRMCRCARASDADVVVCRMMGFDPESGAQSPYVEGPSAGYGVSLCENPSLMTVCSPSACDKIFRTSLFTGAGLFFPLGLAFEDLATTYSLFAHANRIEKVDEFLYFYRRSRGGSIMSSYAGHYEQLTDVLEIMYGRFAADGLFETFRSPIEQVALVQLILGRYADFFLYAPRSVKYSYIDQAFGHLDRHFPGWRKDEVLTRACPGRWLRTISTHRLALKAYVSLPRRIAQSLSWRLGMYSGGA